MKATAEYLRELLLTCPTIAAAGDDLDFHLDFTDNVGDSYSVDSAPTPSEIKRYMDGATLMRFSFTLTSIRDTFSDADRIANALHYEELSNWMRYITKRRLFPALDDTRYPTELNPTGNPYVAARDPDAATAFYQMAGELIYYQRGLTL